MKKTDDESTRRSGLFIGSDPLETVHRRSASKDDDGQDGVSGDHGDDDSSDTDSGDTDGTDKGDDTKDSDGKD